MNEFDKVFADDIEDEVNFDTLFNNDSDLIDLIGSHILESADECRCCNKDYDDEDDEEDDDKDEDEEYDDEKYKVEEISSQNNPDEDGLEGPAVDEKCGGCSKRENCPNGQCEPVDTTDNLDRVLHSGDSSDSVVAPPSYVPQNTSELDRVMNNEPVPKAIEYPQNQEEEGCRRQEACKKEGCTKQEVCKKQEACENKRYCESIDYTSELDALFEEYLEEKVKFSFLPRFKQHPELKSMYSSIDEAEKLLNSNGEPTKNTVENLFKVALRILDIYYNIISVITLPMCILIAPIISHLIGRGIEYAIKCGEVLVAESSTKKVIKKLGKIKKETKDPKVKEKCDKQIKSLSDKLYKLKQNESEIDENPEVTADLDRLMLNDDEDSVEDIKDLQHPDSTNSFIADLSEGATTSDLDNVMNIVNDEDIMPDSEGALDDGDDIDSVNESSFKLL